MPATLLDRNGRGVRLAGQHEIAAYFGVKPSAVANWARRYDDFPAPLAELRGGRVWDLAEVISWERGRR